jgi:transposase
MSDQFWLTGQRDSPCDPEWSAMAGCARGLWPHKTLHNRFVRWSRMGIFDRIFANLAAESGPPDRVMIDSTHLN